MRGEEETDWGGRGTLLHIGIDDTDSREGMCTTHLAARLQERLGRFSEVSCLRLIRLNPNVPWKTRGNAAVSLCLRTRRPERAKDQTLSLVEEGSTLEDEKTHPGVVFVEGEDPPLSFRIHYQKALHRLLDPGDAAALAVREGAEVHRYKEGRGIVGALAAVGCELTERTYEIIAYREPERWGTERRIDPSSVRRMDALTRPHTFNNVDPESGRILIAPRTPCPILFGIRGTDPRTLWEAFRMVDPGEAVGGVALFETNQGTDAHLEEVRRISEARPRASVLLEGWVASAPKTLPGGHVIFTLTDGEETIDCAAYRQSGSFRRVVRRLRVGDRVRVAGGVRSDPKKTINLEKLYLSRIGAAWEERNPLCPGCGRRMESAGRGQGYRCRRCRRKAEGKERIPLPREIEEGWYQVPPGAMRHLSRPLSHAPRQFI
jgi:tRNA(Ile2)-agmatinylcytidine synthase